MSKRLPTPGQRKKASERARLAARTPEQKAKDVKRALAWDAAHRERINEAQRRRHAANPEKYRRQSSRFAANHRAEINARERRRRHENLEAFNEKRRLKRAENREKMNAAARLWREANREKFRAARKARDARRAGDVTYRLAGNLRKRLGRAIRIGSKSGSAVRDLGCSIEELKRHLESRFQPGMTWENWSLRGWHIDHVRPLASFDLSDREQFLAAAHHTNLQPMWAIENIVKSGRVA
jgi:hypothetical protein